ncbi:MAG: sigma 54-interacting transcriptional regulator [Rhizobacter sp.]|nr:sigma 54-interacting transcriptional regulator [Ferruginibacter sp.]
MKEKILIVEDKFVEADYLRLMLTNAGYQVMPIAHTVLQAQELMREDRPDLVLLDIFLKGKLTGIDLAKILTEDNIAFVYLSANSNEEVLNAAKATQPYGFLVKPFREKDLLITLEIARYRHEHSQESVVKKENILQAKLSGIINGQENWENKLLNICKTLQPYISFDYVTAGLNTIEDISSPVLSFFRIGYDEYQKIGVKELLTMFKLKINELVAIANKGYHDATTAIFDERAFVQACLKSPLTKQFAQSFLVKSCICIPLHFSTGEVFMFSLYSRKPDTYNADHIVLLNRLQKLLTNGIEALFNKERQQVALQPEVIHPTIVPAVPATGFEGIIGNSHLLLDVFDLITQVAPSDTSVLILGESGTGKERIADCIHQLSPRKKHPLVKVNCAALPSTLIESELFGHEKGAFTGALDKRIGKFEKADKGTIFLDEIGEMPLDLQVKLLRVLQEKYIERVGSRDITKVDVRIIAATNRNLEKEVAEGRFRLDLYYRLNVFPISLPALRERTEDIPVLAHHFITHYSQKAGKKITALSDKVMHNMNAYHWPGNIRELENVIERSVLLAKGNTIEDTLLPDAKKSEGIHGLRFKTIHENERDYIITVLKKCNGRVWGHGGAAEILNIPATTLKSKMKKLGIQKENFE